MNRTSLAVPARTPLNQRPNPCLEHGYTKLPPGSASGSDALNRWSQERLSSRRPLLHTRTERDRATFSPTGETRRNYLLAKRAAKAVRKRITIENKLAKIAKRGRMAQLFFRRGK
jgi:hypothetical protein